jgi:hypothetical protein
MNEKSILEIEHSQILLYCHSLTVLFFIRMKNAGVCYTL